MSAPSLDSRAVDLVRRLREAANRGNKDSVAQKLLREAADRIEADAIKESLTEYCYQGCKGSGGGSTSLWPFGGGIFG